MISNKLSLSKCTVILMLLLIIPFSGYAEPPKTINYQGYLESTNGQQINGNLDMTFAIYDVDSGPDLPLWVDTLFDVDVQKGIFNVILGETTPLDLPFDEQYYLGVKMGNDSEMTPRQPLASVPYALTASKANSVTSDSIGSAEVLDGSLISKDLATDSVNVKQIGSGAVRSDEVLDNSLTSDDLAEGSVGASEIANGAVGSIEIANDAIGSMHIQDSSITSDDLKINSVYTSEIANGAIISADISDNSITSNDLAPDSVGNSEIINDAVELSKISGTEVAIYQIAPGCTNGSALTTSPTCVTENCGTNLWRLCEYAGSCQADTPTTCSNIKIGYLLSPIIP